MNYYLFALINNEYKLFCIIYLIFIFGAALVRKWGFLKKPCFLFPIYRLCHNEQRITSLTAGIKIQAS